MLTLLSAHHSCNAGIIGTSRLVPTAESHAKSFKLPLIQLTMPTKEQKILSKMLLQSKDTNF